MEKKECDLNCETCNQTSWLHCCLMFSKSNYERLEKLEKAVGEMSSKKEEYIAPTLTPKQEGEVLAE